MVRDICNGVRVMLLQSACYAPLLPYMSRSDTACVCRAYHMSSGKRFATL
jgi:hypothetical protein